MGILKEVVMVGFWQTVPTVQALFGQDYKSFTLFSTTHLCELLFCACVCAAVILLFRHCGEKGRRRTFVIITILLMADEIAKYIMTVSTGQWSWIYLPLHLCSINLFICLANTIRPGKAKKEILYSLCFPGALIALSSPSWTALPVWNFMHLHSLTVHCMLLLYPLLLLADGFRPNYRNLKYSATFILVVTIPIYFLNHALDTNFFFLNGDKTDSNAITKMLAGIFGNRFYIIGFFILLILIWVILYLPWILADRRRLKKHLLG